MALAHVNRNLDQTESPARELALLEHELERLRAGGGAARGNG